MKVSVVTAFTPTPENTRAISGLIYAILKYRPKDIDVNLYNFNSNRIKNDELYRIEKELKVKMKLVKPVSWIKLFNNIWMYRFCKFFVKKPIVCYAIPSRLVSDLRSDDAELIWVYPYFYYRLAHMLPEKSFVVSGCDCEALINVRRFETRVCLNDSKALRHTYLMLKKGLRFEKEWNNPNIKVHFVGEDDHLFYEKIYGYHNSFFIPHPHYSLTEKTISFEKNKLKVIITGGYDVYTMDDVDLMLPDLLNNKKRLLRHYEFTFLGKNWEPVKRVFEENGFPCNFLKWVDDYSLELVKHDIQLAPISYGTGTKGKVLSAIANGLLVVGSKYAFENIEVKSQDSCIQYHQASEIASILLDISNDKVKYQTIAEKGRTQVRTYHNPEKISNAFFETYGKL